MGCRFSGRLGREAVPFFTSSCGAIIWLEPLPRKAIWVMGEGKKPLEQGHTVQMLREPLERMLDLDKSFEMIISA